MLTSHPSRFALLAAVCALTAACSQSPESTPLPTPLAFPAATPAATATAGETPSGQGPSAPAQPTWVTQLPPNNLGLTGRLIFTQGALGVTQWDLSASRVSSIFSPPPNGVVNSASLSPDGKTIVMAYGPPPPPGKPQLGYTSLYTVPVDGSAPPAPLIASGHDHEFYFTPRWSTDGGSIFYGHYIEPGPTVTATPGFFLERRSVPGGDVSTVTQNAFIPYLAHDGSKMVYVTVDPQSYLNNLFVASADGSNATSLLKSGTLWAIDSLAISPDGQSVVFSGDSNGPTAGLPPIYAWLGIRAAQAHSIPEDLWQVPIAGGPVKRLTSLGVTGLAVDYSPDGSHLVFIGSNGINILNADGSGQTQLIGDPTFGSIQWAP